jgi:hypothetical protein
LHPAIAIQESSPPGVEGLIILKGGNSLFYRVQR